MPILKSLSFTAMPMSGSDPVHIRRAKFIEKLGEQNLILQNPGYVRTVQRTADVHGQNAEATGQIIMSVIEFEKGRAGIAILSKDKLPTVINILIEAVRAGEMDDIFASASKSQPASGRNGPSDKLGGPDLPVSGFRERPNSSWGRGKLSRSADRGIPFIVDSRRHRNLALAVTFGRTLK